MKKIISFLLLAALLVGCMIPAVVVSAAGAALTTEAVEIMEGSATDVTPSVTISGNEGIKQLTLVVYYNASEFAKSEAEEEAIYADSIFCADNGTVGKERDGDHKDLRDYVPAELQATHKGFTVELITEDETNTTENGVVVNLPLKLTATEYGTYNYTVVVAADATFNEDDDEVEVAGTTGSVTYVKDPDLGKYDEFTVFTVAPEEIDLEATELDVKVRIDANPGLYGAKVLMVYPDSLKLNGDVESSLRIFKGADEFIGGFSDKALDDPTLDSNMQQIVRDHGLTVDGYLSASAYFEMAAMDALTTDNGLLCTFHFDVVGELEAGEILDIRLYCADDNYIGFELPITTAMPVFTYNIPALVGSDVKVACAHASTSPEHLDPTCGVDGYDRVVCDVCHEIVDETVLPATGLCVPGTPVRVESTCTVPGSVTTYCIHCGEVVSSEPLPLAYHTEGPAATCTAAQTCTVCGTELNPKLPHTEGTPEINEATCDQDGLEVYNCSVCGGFIRDVVLPATGHKYTNSARNEIYPADCENAGYTIRYCDICDAPDVIPGEPALGHNRNGESIVESTCTVPGTMTIYCDVCFEPQEVTELPLAAHKLSAVEAYGPFCHTDGVAAHYACDDCGALFADAEGTQPVTKANLVVEAENDLVHMDEIPACHVPGVQEYWFCPECDCVYADEAGVQLTNRMNLTIPADQELVHMEKVEPCHANGTEEYWFCPECEAVYADEAGTQLTNRMNLTIPADAEAKHVEAVAATCTENGCAEYWYCEECDTHFSDAECKYNVAYLSLTIPATGHDYKDGVCTVCGDKLPADKEDIKEDIKEENKAPVTGDAVVYIVIALAVAVVATGSIVIVRRRRGNN